MKITENGLVLKEVKLREADRILTILTPHHGIVSASARGSLRPNNKLFAASGLYSYSEWTLHEGKTMYSVDEAAPIDVFFGLRNSIEALSLAAYMADLLMMYSPTGAEAQSLLRLALNSLHVVSEKKRSPQMVKTVFELRSLSETGFLPDLLACDGCGKYEDTQVFFDAHQGIFFCRDCAEKKGLRPNATGGVLAALRHIALSEGDKLYSFTASDDSLTMLQRIVEEYLLYHLEYPPKTLAFLKSVL